MTWLKPRRTESKVENRKCPSTAGKRPIGISNETTKTSLADETSAREVEGDLPVHLRYRIPGPHPVAHCHVSA